MCDITASIPFECNNSQGGLSTLVLIPFVENSVTVLNGEGTALDAGITEAFKYEFKGNVHSFNEVKTQSIDNGTSTVVQTLNVTLTKVTATKTAQLNLLSEGRVVAFVKDNNGNYTVLGDWKGMYFNVDKQSGSATGDTNGYVLTGTADAKQLGATLDSATATALEALV